MKDKRNKRLDWYIKNGVTNKLLQKRNDGCAR